MSFWSDIFQIWADIFIDWQHLEGRNFKSPFCSDILTNLSRQIFLLTDNTLKEVTQDVRLRYLVIMSNHNVKLTRLFFKIIWSDNVQWPTIISSIALYSQYVTHPSNDFLTGTNALNNTVWCKQIKIQQQFISSIYTRVLIIIWCKQIEWLAML